MMLVLLRLLYTLFQGRGVSGVSHLEVRTVRGPSFLKHSTGGIIKAIMVSHIPFIRALLSPEIWSEYLLTIYHFYLWNAMVWEI